MKLNEFFKNRFSYSQGVEAWCKALYEEMSGNQLTMTFASDLALEDWNGDTKSVYQLYKHIRKSWIDDYKAFAEVVIAINLLAWANDKLIKQGFENRESMRDFYSELYYESKKDYYKHYKGKLEECDYLYSMTD